MKVAPADAPGKSGPNFPDSFSKLLKAAVSQALDPHRRAVKVSLLAGQQSIRETLQSRRVQGEGTAQGLEAARAGHHEVAELRSRARVERDPHGTRTFEADTLRASLLPVEVDIRVGAGAAGPTSRAETSAAPSKCTAQLCQQIAARVRLSLAGEKSRLALTLKGIWNGTVEVVRTGPGEVRIQARAASGGPALNRAQLFEALRAEGLEVCRLKLS